MKFEQSMEKLQDIASKLENGNLSLDEAMKLYSKGVELCAECTKEIEEAKAKIVVLEKNENNLVETQFEEK